MDRTDGDAQPAQPAQSAWALFAQRSTFDRVLLVVASIAVTLLPAVLVRFVFQYRQVGLDDFWHLLTGSLIVAQRAVPTVDPWCFTTEGFTWNNLNWLAQVIHWKTFELMGWEGAFTLSAVLVCATMMSTWWNAVRRSVHPLLAVAVAALSLWTVMNIYGLRPRMWSFALMAALVLLLAPGRMGWWRAGGALAVMWFWNQLHGGFVYGYGYIGFVGVGCAIDHQRAHGTPFGRKPIVLGAVALLGLAGFIVHPHGFHALVYAVTYPAQFEPAYFEHIIELQPLNFRSLLGGVFEVYLLLCAAGLVLSKRKIRFEEVIPAIIFLHLSLVVMRGTIPFILITSPWLAQIWTGVIEDRGGRLADLSRTIRSFLVPLSVVFPVVVGLVVAWAGVTLLATSTPSSRGALSLPGVADDWRDLGAARYLTSHPEVEGRIFNNYDSGGLLAWALYPQRRLLIDGRGDFHSQGTVFTDYLDVIGLEPGWKERFDSFEADVVMLESDARLVHMLRSNYGWSTLYDDGRYAVIAKQ